MSIETLSISESPCNNCYESYCYKNCDEYVKWEENVNLVIKTLEEKNLINFMLPKEVIEDGSGYGKTCDKKQYICPNCGKIISRVICTKVEKPNHCYRCGQLLKFKGDK
jgi:acetone carboxylase gamma subunit